MSKINKLRGACCNKLPNKITTTSIRYPQYLPMDNAIPKVSFPFSVTCGC